MTLTKTTDLGTISINDSVIAKTILKAASNAEGRLFLSTESGKILGYHTNDLYGNFIMEEVDETYKITFYVIISFGSSIKMVTDKVLDALQAAMQSMFPEYGGVLTMKIVGVKSKNIAERNIEVKREYESSR